MLYPWLNEKVVGGGVDAGALVAFVVFCIVVGWQIWVMWIPISDFMGWSDRGAVRVQQQNAAMTQIAANNNSGGFIPTPTPQPTEPGYVLLVTPTPGPTAIVAATPTFDNSLIAQVDALPPGYRRQRIVGRFSNYWPANGGINAQGDAELFADGTRVDQALVEGQRVVACPPELLLGTRIEWPPASGVVWTCRDRGEAITFYYAESGLPVYWFDFLAEDAFVDYGSYIQVDLFVPEG